MDEQPSSVEVDRLQRDVAAVLAMVRAGTSVVVTEGGRPVARLVPYVEHTGFERWLEEGTVILPTRDRRAFSAPRLDAGPGNPGSAALAADRDDDH